MSEKRFQKTRIVDKWGGIYDSETDEVLNVNDITNKLNEFNEQLKTLLELLNEQQTEIERLKEECDALQKKTEMDKNDFCISEVKRMTLLAFIEDNGLRKEYYEWERRIYDEKCP